MTYDSNYEEATFDLNDGEGTRTGTILQRNGNLSLVQDHETGRTEWFAPHELSDA
jgi:hypothetical protein